MYHHTLHSAQIYQASSEEKLPMLKAYEVFEDQFSRQPMIISNEIIYLSIR